MIGGVTSPSGATVAPPWVPCPLSTSPTPARIHAGTSHGGVKVGAAAAARWYASATVGEKPPFLRPLLSLVPVRALTARRGSAIVMVSSVRQPAVIPAAAFVDLVMAV